MSKESDIEKRLNSLSSDDVSLSLKDGKCPICRCELDMYYPTSYTEEWQKMMYQADIWNTHINEVCLTYMKREHHLDRIIDKDKSDEGD